MSLKPKPVERARKWIEYHKVRAYPPDCTAVAGLARPARTGSAYPAATPWVREL